MSLLYEYALTPDIFDKSFYAHEDVGTARFEHLKDIFLEEALARNLRNGEWLSLFKNGSRPWHHRGIELIKKMAKQNRLRAAAAALPDVPGNDVEWCKEALASHGIQPLTGIITSRHIIDEIGHDSILGGMDRLGSAPCWTCRGTSVRLKRCLSDYEVHLKLIMNSANSIMFIDPHLDPTQRRYESVLPIIRLTQDRRPLPLIEVHRIKTVGSGRNTQIINPMDWEARFRRAWGPALSSEAMQVEIFIWDGHHDRYLIADNIGIEMGNGFDVSNRANVTTTWSRISRKDRDDIQREFDPASNRHKLWHRFIVP